MTDSDGMAPPRTPEGECPMCGFRVGPSSPSDLSARETEDNQERTRAPDGASLIERAAQIADAVGAEQQAKWEENGGEEGTPLWINTIPSKEWMRQARRYSGAGGADAAEEIAARIRALASVASAPAGAPEISRDIE